MANACIFHHEAGKVLHLLDRKEMAYTREIPLSKADCRPLSVFELKIV